MNQPNAGRCMSMQAMQALNELRENNQLCDAVIVLDDDTEIGVHRALLSACSSYFRYYSINHPIFHYPIPTFRSTFITPLRSERDTKIRVPGVKSDLMMVLLDYVYLRKLNLDPQNVYDMLITADYLCILGVVEMCCNYLESILSADNCIGIMSFASNYFCQNLSQRVWKFIMKNFVEISLESNEILKLPLNDLLKIINADNLNVKSEEIVWDLVLKWINYDPSERKQHIVVLMKGIRLGLLDTQFFLEKVKDHQYVTACEESRPMIIATLKFLYDLETIANKYVDRSYESFKMF